VGGHGHTPLHRASHDHFPRLVDPVDPRVEVVVDDVARCRDQYGTDHQQHEQVKRQLWTEALRNEQLAALKAVPVLHEELPQSPLQIAAHHAFTHHHHGGRDDQQVDRPGKGDQVLHLTSYAPLR
jgi:hypothetical protein